MVMQVTCLTSVTILSNHMNLKIKLFIFSSLLIAIAGCTPSEEALHSFEMDPDGFLLDGKHFQMISGEVHYCRIPREYWRHRIRMAKAMGCNTIATYVFWSHHETEKGSFDFTSGNRNLAEFIEIVQDEGMWFLLRPGPYCCGEWDMGGIPPYLLSIPDIKLRCTDERYMAAAARYIDTLSHIITPHLITNGGPIIMLQIENEYGSYGNDREYLKRIKKRWDDNGIDIPYCTADGATTHMLEAGTLPGVAVGLDPGVNQENFDLARKMNPGVPVFSSETYPGWLTHWGEEWSRPDTAYLFRQVRYLLENKLSVNFYVLHGGTNFGYSAGANSGGTGYQPDVTSYDFDAPINEQGQARPKYYALKNLIKSYGFYPEQDVPQPGPIPTVEIPGIEMETYSTVWNNLPPPIAMVQPKPFEYFGQYYGFALYRTKLIGHKSGELKITDLHDYATVFVDGKYVGTVDRSQGENSIELPVAECKIPVLEILVEGMGRINYAQELIDRKGITERVSLNGMTLMNWEVFSLPMDPDYIKNLNPSKADLRPGVFFRGEFALEKVADTYIDMSNYKKGLVWVNGHNLGRYWDIGPQYALYCPAPFLVPGRNEIIVFDLHRLEPRSIKGIEEPL
jgi:hypothetical protein